LLWVRKAQVRLFQEGVLGIYGKVMLLNLRFE